MGLRDNFLVPQDLTEGDVTALQGIMTAATEDVASPVRRVYTDLGPSAKQPIALKNMDDAEWTATIALLATSMYDTDNG